MSMLIYIYDKQETLLLIKLRFLKILHAGQLHNCLKMVQNYLFLRIIVNKCVTKFDIFLLLSLLGTHNYRLYKHL